MARKRKKRPESAENLSPNVLADLRALGEAVKAVYTRLQEQDPKFVVDGAIWSATAILFDRLSADARFNFLSTFALTLPTESQAILALMMQHLRPKRQRGPSKSDIVNARVQVAKQYQREHPNWSLAQIVRKMLLDNLDLFPGEKPPFTVKDYERITGALKQAVHKRRGNVYEAVSEQFSHGN